MTHDPKPPATHWLDPVIAAQAAYYGQTVGQFAKSSKARAELCELITEDMEGDAV